MSRLPFDPERIEGPLEPERPARRERRQYAAVTDAEHLTVSQASELIKITLEQRLPSPLRIVGEVSNLNTPGHWYFSLKDEHAVLQCVAWASSVRRFRFTPKDGDEILATGHISHFEQQGRTQLYVSAIEPIGAGPLELRFRAMCDELRGLGYFDAAHKKTLPAFPRRIAVITSARGAAVQDVIDTARQRNPSAGLLVVNVKVQGDGAAEEVARAIRAIDARRSRLGVDALLVTRGGGSLEDLWAFNERIVADAVFEAKIPIIAAIGHESDTTVIELVADVRAATPTQAAMRLIPSRDELTRQVDHLSDRLHMLMHRIVRLDLQRLESIERHELFRSADAFVARHRRQTEDLAKTLRRASHARLHRAQIRLERLAARLIALSPTQLLVRRRERLAIARDRLNRAGSLMVQRHRFRLDGFARTLHSVDPRQVLRRGFSYTTDEFGGVIRSVRSVQAGIVVHTHLQDGAFHSRVVNAKRRRRAGSEQKLDEPDQMDLFTRDE